MNSDPGHTRTLRTHECWALLRSTTVGRLAINQDGQPDIFPINFVVDHGTIVFRTSEGTKSHAAEKAQVAFEADAPLPEAQGHTGAAALQGNPDRRSTVWSVVVKGRVATITTTVELLDTVELPLHPWEAGRKDRFMRLVPDTISGRSFDMVSPTAPINSEADPLPAQ